MVVAASRNKIHQDLAQLIHREGLSQIKPFSDQVYDPFILSISFLKLYSKDEKLRKR